MDLQLSVNANDLKLFKYDLLKFIRWAVNAGRLR